MYYSYAPNGLRVWRGNGSSSDELTFWNPAGQKLGTYNLSVSGSTLIATQSGTNYYFGGKLIKNATGWVHTNRQGSIGSYYPYGTDKGSSNPSNGSEKFTGYQRDSETGNDYAMSRYEQPGTGRFLTPDRITGKVSDPGTWNLYSYVGGDPINRTDGSGEFWCSAGSGDYTGCDLVGPDQNGTCWVMTAMGEEYLTAGGGGCRQVVWGDPTIIGIIAAVGSTPCVGMAYSGSSGCGTSSVGQQDVSYPYYVCEIQVFAGKIPTIFPLAGIFGVPAYGFNGGYHTWIVTTEYIVQDGYQAPLDTVVFEAGNAPDPQKPNDINWQPTCLVGGCWLNTPSATPQADEAYGYTGTMIWDSGVSAGACLQRLALWGFYSSWQENTTPYHTFTQNSNSFVFSLLNNIGLGPQAWLAFENALGMNIFLFGWGAQLSW